jgi:hypothetical protein
MSARPVPGRSTLLLVRWCVRLRPAPALLAAATALRLTLATSVRTLDPLGGIVLPDGRGVKRWAFGENAAR